MEHPIEYNRYGRMVYNPEFHAKQGTPWSYNDLKYLIDWYDVAGAEEMSFALERTITTVMEKARSLRKKGIMPTAKHVMHKREIKKSTFKSAELNI